VLWGFTKSKRLVMRSQVEISRARRRKRHSKNQRPAQGTEKKTAGRFSYGGGPSGNSLPIRSRDCLPKKEAKFGGTRGAVLGKKGVERASFCQKPLFHRHGRTKDQGGGGSTLRKTKWFKEGKKGSA